MEPELLRLYKRVGETPLECILHFRSEHIEYQKIPMTYLGRLDPMAEGLLLVLAGDTKGKKEFLEWDKTYEFEVLWGFETDTYDVLGLVTETEPMPAKLDFKMAGLLQKIKDKKMQSYPPYSSRTVSGKALHTWAREGKIDEIEIPMRSVKIFDIEHLDTQLVAQKDILPEIISKINLVKGDFRQEESIESWEKAIDMREIALISSFKASVSSGTYIRSLAHEMGHTLGTSSLAYSIKRTRVGEYRLDKI
jgi:tRNA pseudouridine55 synthase